MTQLLDIKDKEQCFKACSERENTTGCQYVTPDLSSISCWVFTGEVAKGSERVGQEYFTCWKFGGLETKYQKDQNSACFTICFPLVMKDAPNVEEFKY